MSAAPSLRQHYQHCRLVSWEAASHQNTWPAKKAKHVGLPGPVADWTAGRQSAALLQATIWLGFWGGNSGVVLDLSSASKALNYDASSIVKTGKNKPNPNLGSPPLNYHRTSKQHMAGRGWRRCMAFSSLKKKLFSWNRFPPMFQISVMLTIITFLK